MVSRKLYTEQGKLVATLIETGELDQDLHAILRLLQFRKKQRSEGDRDWIKHFDPQEGELFRFKTDRSFGHLPQYLRGAITKVVMAKAYWGFVNGKNVKVMRPHLEILHLDYKPRGGFGSEPRYSVGDRIGYVNWFEVERYYESDAISEVEQKIRKIKEKHERPANA